MPYPVSVTGARLALRELRAGDADALHAVYGDPQATEHLSFEPQDRAQVARFVTAAAREAHDDPRTFYALAVADAHSPGLIGFARLSLGPHRSAELGLALHPSVWGQGYGTETVGLLLRLGFERLRLHRIWGARSPRNVASAVAMARNGMLQEGRIRDHLFTHGAWRDSVAHSVLEHEWRPPAGD